MNTATASTTYFGGRGSTPLSPPSSSSSSSPPTPATTHGSNRTNATLQRQYQRQQHHQQHHHYGGVSGFAASKTTVQWGRWWMIHRRSNSVRKSNHALLYPPPQQQQYSKWNAVATARHYYNYNSNHSPTPFYSPQTATMTTATTTGTTLWSGTGSSSTGTSGGIKLRSSRVISLVSALVLGIVILEGHYYTRSLSSSSSVRRFKNHSRHISPIVIVAVSTGSSTSSSTARTTGIRSGTVATSTSSSSSTTASSAHHSLSPRSVSSDTATKTVTLQSIDSIIHRANNNETTTVPRRQINERPEWLESYLAFHQQHVLPLEQRRKQRKRDNDPVLRFRLVHDRHRDRDSNATMPRQSSDDTDEYTPSLTYRCNGQSCGGIGDRLQGVIQTFFMAVCSNRLFTIDWHEKSPRGVSVEPNDTTEVSHRTTTTTMQRPLLFYLQPRDVQWDAIDNQPSSKTTTTTKEEDDDENEPKILHAMDNRNLTLLIEPDAILPIQNVLLQTNLWMGDTFLNGQCWQSYRRRFPPSPSVSSVSTTHESAAAAVYRLAFDALFTWSPMVQNAAAILRQRAQLSTSRHFVGLHVRTGLIQGSASVGGSIDRSMPQRHAEPTEWTRFLHCAYKVRSKLRERWCPDLGDDNDRIVQEPWMDLYLASDHRSVKEALLVEDPSIKTVLDLTIHHVDTKTQLDATSETSGVDGSLAAWSELFILQEAVCLVQSHSKYSAVAGAISESQCAVHFDDCSDETVSLAVSSVANDRESGKSNFMMCG